MVRFRKHRNEPPAVIAHRGCSATAPENTIAAVRQALNQRIPWIEIDVQLSADDVVVVMHDRTLRRTSTGRGDVRSSPYSLLQTFDAGSWFDPSFAGERIPRLADVLDVVGSAAFLNIEVKTFPFHSVQPAHLAVKVLAVVHDARAKERVLLSSFDHRLLGLVREHDASIALGVLASWPRDAWSSPSNLAGRVGAQAYICDHRRLAPGHVRDAHANDLEVLAYTVNDETSATACKRMGVDGLISDRPLSIQPVITI